MASFCYRNWWLKWDSNPRPRTYSYYHTESLKHRVVELESELNSVTVRKIAKRRSRDFKLYYNSPTPSFCGADGIFSYTSTGMARKISGWTGKTRAFQPEPLGKTGTVKRTFHPKPPGAHRWSYIFIILYDSYIKSLLTFIHALFAFVHFIRWSSNIFIRTIVLHVASAGFKKWVLEWKWPTRSARLRFCHFLECISVAFPKSFHSWHNIDYIIRWTSRSWSDRDCNIFGAFKVRPFTLLPTIHDRVIIVSSKIFFTFSSFGRIVAFIGNILSVRFMTLTFI